MNHSKALISAKNRNAATAILKAAILTMSFVQMGTNGIAPILSEIAASFPSASASTVQFLMTFPAIFVVFFSLAGAFLSEKISQKKLAVTGLILVAAGGLLSFFFHGSLRILFVFAAVTGIGIGLVSPIAPALINQYFDGQEKQTLLGLQNSSSTVGSMLMTFFCGILAAFGWHCGYLVYLIGIPGIFLTMAGVSGISDRAGRATGLSDGNPAYSPRVSSGKAYSVKREIRCVLREMITAFFFLMCFSAVPANLSMLVSEKNLGSASYAGTLSSLYLLGGMLSGLLYGSVAPRLKDALVPVGAMLLAFGSIVIFFSPGKLLIAFACLIGGASISFVMPTCMSAASRIPGREALLSAMILAGSNIGVFAAPVLTALSEALFRSGSAAPRFLVIGAGAVIIAAIHRICGTAGAFYP